MIKKKDILWTAALFLTLTIFVASSNAAVRVAPIVKAPISVPNIGMPLYPFPIEQPGWGQLPMTLNLLPDGVTPAPSLPNAGPNIVLPEPIETPKWPTHVAQNVRVVSVNRTELGVQKVRVRERPQVVVGQQELPADAFGDLIDEVRGHVGITAERSVPTAQNLRVAFDGAEKGRDGGIVVAEEDDGYVEPRPFTPHSDGQTLPEDELIRDIGL